MPSHSARQSLRGSLPRDVQVSKKLSWLLRHGANKEGLKFQRGGYINVQDVLQCSSVRRLGITFNELRNVVATNNKQRFSLIPTELIKQDDPTKPPAELANDIPNVASDLDDPSHYLIRANQGHSIAVNSEDLLKPVTEVDMPDLVVHGTTAKAWKLILQSGGLKPMNRNHVHFASDLPDSFKEVDDGSLGMSEDAAPVISGMRNSSSILIYIDIPKALSNGLRFWQSENGVILSEGNEDGIIKTELFKKVENRNFMNLIMQDGKLLWDPQINYSP